MSRERTIEISALNIAMHKPHSPQRYVDLFADARGLEFLVEQGELHGIMLGPLYGVEDAVSKNELTGEIYRFVKIDSDEPWFNVETRQQATDKETEGINIPPHLLAHMQHIQFVFYPKEHQLWFICKDRKDRLAPNAAERFFETLFTHVASLKGYPEVAVTALPDAAALEEMLSIHRLGKIVMHFKRPNADDDDDAEVRFMKRLEDQQIKAVTEELTAEQYESIIPDETTRREARIASRNGSVTVIGTDAEGVRVKESTSEKPTRLFRKVNEAVETAMAVLRRTK